MDNIHWDYFTRRGVWALVYDLSYYPVEEALLETGKWTKVSHSLEGVYVLGFSCTLILVWGDILSVYDWQETVLTEEGCRHLIEVLDLGE